MNTTPTAPTAPQSPREQASQLVNAFASKTASLEAATAETRAQITTLTAALNQASAPYLMELAKLEDEAKALALKHGPEIFGDKRSLTENGYTLGLRETAAVVVDNEESAIRMIQGDAKAVSILPDSEDTVMALNACLRITITLDREYITRHYDEHPEWFGQYGISVEDRQSASLKKAPPPRVAKPKQKKVAKQLKTTAQAEEQEAA